MVDRRPEAEDTSRAKRQKMEKPEVDPRDNPYLAHMFPDKKSSGNPLDKFVRHKTTAAQAQKVEDGEINPFTGRPFSETYYSILKSRRNLPVHAQR